MTCAYCKREIGTNVAVNGGIVAGLHINERGYIEKCYTKRKFPMSLLFGKRDYRGVKAVYMQNSPRN